jgi:uncharacterized repeat protein (TIGR03803 family)
VPCSAWITKISKGRLALKARIKDSLLLPAVIAGLNLAPVGGVTAQTFTTLHSFTPSSTNASGVYTNSDGANPYAGLTVAGDGGIRYGTTSSGGSSGKGTVFAINTDGTGFTVLHSFSGGSDGANPWTGLVLSGNTLYGTAHYGGGAGAGTVFAVNTDGTGFTNLHTFTGGSDGAYPNGGLIVSGSTLYGTAAYGGSAGVGTVFAINTDGTGFTNLHTFTPTYPQRFYFYYSVGYGYFVQIQANADGAVPVAGLILAGNTLYGTASGGGVGGNGTVFSVHTDGTGFTTLHSFEQTYNLTQHPIGIGGGGGGIGGGGCSGDTSCPPGAQCIGGACACRGFCGGG